MSANLREIGTRTGSIEVANVESDRGNTLNRAQSGLNSPEGRSWGRGWGEVVCRFQLVGCEGWETRWSRDYCMQGGRAGNLSYLTRKDHR
jgi:hypothetical protein